MHDRVQGDVRFPNKDLDDFIILRSDGTPTYMHAVVVDDHDMGVTHIIRGDDHLTNAARQTIIYKGMGWDVPVMAHIPLIHGADGAKLSKRHGALGVEAYRAHGLSAGGAQELPRAPRLEPWRRRDHEPRRHDPLVRDRGRQQGRGALRLPEAGGAERHLYAPDGQLTSCTTCFIRTLPYLENGKPILDRLDERREAQLRAAMPGLKERAKTLVELADGASFLFAERPLVAEEKAAALLQVDRNREILKGAHKALANVSGDWTAASAEAAIREYASGNGLKLGEIAQPLRAALTGRLTSPGVFDVLAVLGADESLARIGDKID